MKASNFLTILLLITLAACNDKAEENGNGFYPISIGTSWNYECTNYYTSYDSTGKFLKLVHTTELQTTIITKDTLINGNILRQFVTTHNVKPTTFSTAVYFKQDNEGLKQYGYSDYGGTWSLDEIIDSVSQHATQSAPQRHKVRSNFSDVILYKVPFLYIPNSLSDNLDWNYNSGIHKHVVGKDTLHIDGKAYPCYKVETIEPTEYKFYYEWISNAGLLKCESESVMNDWVPGDNSYGQYVNHEITIVKSLNLK